jgi:hypothetical protein
MKSTITKVAGVTFGDAQENIKKFGCRDIGSFRLVREPDNTHDPNAIRVEIAGHYLGHIPKDKAKELAPLIDDGRNFIALFVNLNEHPLHDIVGLTIKIVEYPYHVAA